MFIACEQIDSEEFNIALMVDIPVKPATDSGRYLPPECQQNGA